tara:strand:- start:306 stop:692 length:387 start_codon:yes stop_codon:yes gene_type:complete
MSLFKKRTQQRAGNKAAQPPERYLKPSTKIAVEPDVQFAAQPAVRAVARKPQQQQPSWEVWYAKFKVVATAGNPRLQLQGTDENIIDLMDHTPLQDAYNMGLDANQLGEQFAKDFDVGAFLRDNGIFK